MLTSSPGGARGGVWDAALGGPAAGQGSAAPAAACSRGSWRCQVCHNRPHPLWRRAAHRFSSIVPATSRAEACLASQRPMRQTCSPVINGAPFRDARMTLRSPTSLPKREANCEANRKSRSKPRSKWRSKPRSTPRSKSRSKSGEAMHSYKHAQNKKNLTTYVKNLSLLAKMMPFAIDEAEKIAFCTCISLAPHTYAPVPSNAPRVAR